MNEYIIGIDIGSSKVCAAAGKIDKYGGLQIMGITSSKCSGVKKGIVVDIDSTSDSIKECIESLETMIDTKIGGAYIGLPGSISELAQNRGVIAVSSEDREIKASDVRRVLKAAKIVTVSADKEIIGVIPQQYIVDGYDKIKDPIGMSGLRLEVDAQLILAPSTVVNNVFKSINKAGIKVLGVVFQPFAISNVLLKNEEMDRGVALVDIGSDSTVIYVFEEEKLISIETVALGGNILTNDIALCLKLPFSEAEKIKLKYGSVGKDIIEHDLKIEANADYNDKVEVDYNMLKQIIEARVEELLCIVGEKLNDNGYYKRISGIVMVGGGISLIRGIEEFSKELLGKPVRVGTPAYIGAANPMYASAVGIVKDVSDSRKEKYSSGSEEKEEELGISLDEDKLETNKENSGGFISKIKEFLSDFF